MLKFLTSFLVVSILFLLIQSGKTDEKCASVQDDDRLDCISQGDITEEKCKERGCCWDELSKFPSCFYKPKARSYIFTKISEFSDGIEAELVEIGSSPYPYNIEKLKFSVNYLNDNILRIKITDSVELRYETPFPEMNFKSSNLEDPLYEFVINDDTEGFKILRKSDNVNIFDVSDMANLIFSDQFIQITPKLPSSSSLYGLGEHNLRLKLSTNWTTLTMFNRDTSPSSNRNLYGSHPFYLIMENSTKSHGVFLKNSNGMDVIIQPTPAITFRTIGGILDFFIFLGPSPTEVLQQYQEIIGKPKMPPYWSLGFHLCRYGIYTLNATEEVLQRNLDAGIPVETQWNDLDYMENNNDFTYSSESFGKLPQFVKKIHESGRRYVILLDPGISASEINGTYFPFDEAVQEDILIKNDTDQILIAKVWNPVSTVYPDFTNPKTHNYWKKMLEMFHSKVPFDGVWIDMNEPSNFDDGSAYGCPENSLENPPYVPNVLDGTLRAKTVCMSAKQYAGIHYNVHNLYGISEANITSLAMMEILGQRSLVISRSTFPGSGRYGGHWSGDINSNWDDMKLSISQLLAFSLYGIPLMGSDICGFGGISTKPLCNRWMQLGAFYPFSRNHNTIHSRDQDPASMGEQVIKSSIKALRTRYTLLPYLYTLFWEANQYGTTVARPLFLEFPEDPNTYDIDTSFLWGSSLLIIPVLEDDPEFISTYIPKGVWYNFYTKIPIFSENGGFFNIPSDLETIHIFIRGGHILPIQNYGNTTEEVRNSMFKLIVALDENGEANGKFYWDDGISIDIQNNYTLFTFKAANSTLKIQKIHEGSQKAPSLSSVEIILPNISRNSSYLKENILQIDTTKFNKYPIILNW